MSKFLALFLVFTIGLGAYKGYDLYIQDKYGTNVSLEQVMELPKDLIVLDSYTLDTCKKNKPCGIEKFLKKLTQKILLDKDINIFISSNGGNIGVMNDLRTLLNFAKKNSKYITCYVEKAYSAAFSILQICDKRIGLKNSKYLTHFIHNGYGYTHKSSYPNIVKHCKMEADDMKIDWKKWCLKSRIEGEDVMFNAEEALKENIIDEIL